MRKHHHVREGQIVRVIDGPLTGFRGEVKEVDETDRQSGRSGIWPRYPDGLGAWADRVGARKFKLRHYQNFPASAHVDANGGRGDG